MMLKRISILLLFLTPLTQLDAWGFFGHKLINRVAVFTLPEEMMGFYKFHIQYISDHAVDPDKRRYSDTAEGCRHFIDLDYYEKSVPIDTVPFYWKDAVLKYSQDTLLTYGIVPWHVQIMIYRLTSAFKANDPDRILKYSAEIGHYISDACVPLHATMNYNGQLSGQSGIHGFWESRLPELFSSEYDFYVGRSAYLQHPPEEIWSACAGSFNAKDSVLNMEKELNAHFAPDKKYTFEQKGNTQVKTYSREYAEAYHKMLSGMVERRMQLAVKLVGSLWYTAWVDAGQPDLRILLPQVNSEKTRHDELEEQLKELQLKQMLGRPE